MKPHLNLLLTLFLAVALLSGCEKEEDQPACERYKTGTITISNSSSNPTDIYIDDVFQMELAGNHISTKLEIKEGNNRKLYAKQVSGYVFFPTERTENFNVVRCSDYSWQIP